MGSELKHHVAVFTIHQPGRIQAFMLEVWVILVHFFPRPSFRMIPRLCLEKLPFFSHSRLVEYETRRAFRAQSTVREAELSVRPVILIPSNLPSASLSLHPSNSHRQNTPLTLYLTNSTKHA